MPPKRKAAPKKKQETPPPSESEPESEPEYSSEEEPESPKPKKTKPGPKPRAAAAPKAKVAPTASPKAKVAPTPSPKKAKAAPPPKKQPAKRGAAKGEVVAEPAPLPKQVTIEHCKQCQSFKRTATKLEALLKKSIPDLKVTMNPEQPRKGVFEVRDSEGNIFVSLQGLTRPFKKMKDLDLEETAEDVVSKLT